MTQRYLRLNVCLHGDSGAAVSTDAHTGVLSGSEGAEPPECCKSRHSSLFNSESNSGSFGRITAVVCDCRGFWGEDDLRGEKRTASLSEHTDPDLLYR